MSHQKIAETQNGLMACFVWILYSVINSICFLLFTQLRITLTVNIILVNTLTSYTCIMINGNLNNLLMNMSTQLLQPCITEQLMRNNKLCICYVSATYYIICITLLSRNSVLNGQSNNIFVNHKYLTLSNLNYHNIYYVQLVP